MPCFNPTGMRQPAQHHEMNSTSLFRAFVLHLLKARLLFVVIYLYRHTTECCIFAFARFNSSHYGCISLPFAYLCCRPHSPLSSPSPRTSGLEPWSSTCLLTSNRVKEKKNVLVFLSFYLLPQAKHGA